MDCNNNNNNCNLTALLYTCIHYVIPLKTFLMLFGYVLLYT